MAEEKLNLCLKQAEWLLFQANIFDVEINPDSMRVIVEARRVVSGGKKEKDIDQFVEIASHAYADEGGIHTPDHRFTLNKYSVAWLCWHVGCVCCGRISITGTAGSEIKDLYMWPAGSLMYKSPIAIWLHKERTGRMGVHANVD